MSDDPNVHEALAAIERAGGLITREEIAKEWRVPLQTVMRRIERGEFPPPLRRVSGSEIYLRAQVEPLRFVGGILRGVSARHQQIDPDAPR
jgi:hypothetical protein